MSKMNDTAMVERVAVALLEILPAMNHHYDELSPRGRELWCEKARIVIAAMREPTDAMVGAGAACPPWRLQEPVEMTDTCEPGADPIDRVIPLPMSVLFKAAAVQRPFPTDSFLDTPANQRLFALAYSIGVLDAIAVIRGVDVPE